MIENMTNEQAAECLKTIHVLSFKDETATFFLIDVQNAFKLAIKALEQEPVLDKIRAEIEQRKKNSSGEPNRDLAFNVCLQIIDKYKAESEE